MKGHSFYLFDLDHNLINTQSPTFLYHKETGEEIRLETVRYSKIRKDVGLRGEFKDYREDDSEGKSFRYFQGGKFFLEELDRLVHEDQPWRGPSWDIFCRALKNGRHMSIITARATDPVYLQKGFDWLYDKNLLPEKVRFFKIYSVSNSGVKEFLGGQPGEDISDLKCKAISHFIESAYKKFGTEALHKFGMSDDDPKNIKAAFDQFVKYKKLHPHHSFYTYEACASGIEEREVLGE